MCVFAFFLSCCPVVRDVIMMGEESRRWRMRRPSRRRRGRSRAWPAKATRAPLTQRAYPRREGSALTYC